MRWSRSPWPGCQSPCLNVYRITVLGGISKTGDAEDVAPVAFSVQDEANAECKPGNAANDARREMARVRAAVIVAVAALLVLGPMKAKAGAPRRDGRFMNLAGPRQLPGAGAMLPFFLRKVWTSMVGRAGGVRLVPFDRQ